MAFASTETRHTRTYILYVQSFFFSIHLADDTRMNADESRMMAIRFTTIHARFGGDARLEKKDEKVMRKHTKKTICKHFAVGQ